MANEMIINRTTLNGTKWQIVADVYGAALYIENHGKEGYHFSGRFFQNVEEAEGYLNKIDEKVLAPVQVFIPTDVPADYYGVSGRHYGD